jgi:hypothetical protein
LKMQQIPNLEDNAGNYNHLLAVSGAKR